MDSYTRLKKIGEGSFGQALLVKGKKDGRHYVIKEIGVSKMDRRGREEARKEVKVLSQMKHPNIVAYQDSFEEKGSLYIVMDYCDGGDLYSRINSQKGRLFPEPQVLDWFVQLCLALKHVHDRKILHRDIKTQNVFLTKSGMVKLGDFGIARVLSSTVELARTCIGTPYYLSPEICENKPYNNKSDIWSLGCVLYELVTLKHAFEAGNMRNLVLKIIRGSYPSVSSRYSLELRQLIDTCLKHYPRQRPSINSLLRTPIIQKRIQKFLSETVARDEFSHTTLHHKKPSDNPPAHRPFAQPKHNPSIHDDPVIKKRPDVQVPADRRQSEERRRVVLKPRARADKPSALDVKKKEMLEQAKQQRDEILKQRKVESEMRLEQQLRKQELNRIEQARQKAAMGWQLSLSGGGVDKDGDIVIKKENKHEEQVASERVSVVSEYQSRQKAAMDNKRRAEGKGGVKYQPPHGRGQPHPPPMKNKAEQEYLARLEAIRRQNYLERKKIKERGRAPQLATPIKKDEHQQTPPHHFDVESRRKKIAALKAQAEHEAAKVREKVELKQKEREFHLQNIKANKQISPPRKKWEEPSLEPVVVAAMGEQTGVISEETSSVVVFEYKRVPEVSKPPRAAWGAGQEQPLVVAEATQLPLTGQSNTSVGTVVLFGKLSSTSEGEERKPDEVGKTVVIDKAKVIVCNDQDSTSVSNETSSKIDSRESTSSDKESDVKDTPIIVETPLKVQTTPKKDPVTTPTKEPVTTPPVVKTPPTIVETTPITIETTPIVIEATSTVIEATHSSPMKDPPLIVKQAWDTTASDPVKQSTELKTEDSPSIDPSNTTSHVNNEPVKDDGNNIEPSVSNGAPDPVKGLGADRVFQLLQDKMREEKSIISGIVQHNVTDTQSSKDQSAAVVCGEDDMMLQEYEAELEERERGEGETPFNTSSKSLGEDLMESINNGAFDALNTKNLRTCSLPDLSCIEDTSSSTSLLPTDKSGVHDKDKGANSAHLLTVEDSNSSSDDDNYVSDDDEHDMQQLLSTLQRVYNEVCSPPRSRPPTPGEDLQGAGSGDNGSVMEEGWAESDEDESDSEEESGTRGLNVFVKLEETRSNLEDIIGMDKLMEAYTIIQDFQEEEESVNPLEAMEDEGSSFPLERLTSILGTDHTQHFPALIHLVVADYTYYNHSETINCTGRTLLTT